MGEVLNNGVYLPDRGERNAYDGLKGNWNTLDSIAGKVPGYDGHISDTDIHVTAADKQTWNGKADASHVHNANDVTTGVFDAARIPNLDASKITTGTIDIDRLPQGALERLVKVADQAARYALTASDVQLGDTVQQLDTGVMYVVTDETKLDSADGYTEYTAGSATSVPWSGVTGKPADYTPASHSHGNITNDGKVGTAANKPLITGTDGVVQAGAFGNAANTFCEGNDSRLSDARTPVAHTHVTADVTDLLNSDHTWSGDNTYSKTVAIERSTDTGNFLALKNTVAELGSTPASATPVTIAYRDKNNDNLGYMGVYYDTDGSNHFRLYVRNKYTSEAPSTTGSYDYAFFGLRLNADKSKEGILRASFRPYDSNTYDLGSSSYQWNNLYASKIRQIDSFSSYADVYQVLDSSNNRIVSFRITKEANRNTLGINVHDQNNSAPKGLVIENDLSNNITITGGGVNNYLGTSTNQWKTLNGINPGALSLPDGGASNADTTFNPDLTNWPMDGTAFTITAQVTGWLHIRIKNSTGNFAWVKRGAAGANQTWGIVGNSDTNSDIADIPLNVPVIQNYAYTLKIKSSTVYAAIFMCLGNV